MIARDVYVAPVTLSRSGVRIGQSVYIYAVAAVNFALVLLSLSEAVGTRVWKGFSRWNFADVKSLVVGTAKGGAAVAAEAETIRIRYGHGDGGRHAADRSEEEEDKALGRIQVRLVSHGAADWRLEGAGRNEEAEKVWRRQGDMEQQQGRRTWNPDKNAATHVSELEYLHGERYR